MNSRDKQPRIGIYAGTFDPVHAGHISFALLAKNAAQLDAVYLLPERMPQNKPGAAHYGHRVAMLRRAVAPHASLGLLELVDKRLSLQRTMPQLRRTFKDAKLVLVMGADVFVNLPHWTDAQRLLKDCEFAVSVRGHYELPMVLHIMQRLALPTSSVTIVDSMQPEVSSTQMRIALAMNRSVKGLLPSVRRYARREWLYVRLPRG